MKVILKDIPNKFGHSDNCHVAEFGELNLMEGRGMLRIRSYRDVEAFSAGRPATMERDVHVRFDEILSFDALWCELASKILQDDPVFSAGALCDAARPGAR